MRGGIRERKKKTGKEREQGEPLEGRSLSSKNMMNVKNKMLNEGQCQHIHPAAVGLVDGVSLPLAMD